MTTKDKVVSAVYRSGKKWLGGRGLRSNPVLGAGYDFFSKVFKTRIIEVEGLSLYVNLESGIDFNETQGAWEKEITQYIKDTLKPGDVFFDVGAEIGYYTCLAAKMGCVVYAFEPNPITYKILEKNIALNGNGDKVHLFAKALSDFNGPASLFLHGAQSSVNHTSLYPENTKQATIDCVRLDDFARNPENNIPEKITLMKIDIEGFELKALRGMRELLQKNKQMELIVEVLPELQKLAHENPDDLVKFFLEGGYSIKQLDEDDILCRRA